MIPKALQKYVVNKGGLSENKKAKSQSFFDWVKKHAIGKGDKIEHLAANMDKILYGKQ